MSVDVLMPKLGESITEGTILEWKKNVGDMVEKDETLLEISTDKVDSKYASTVPPTNSYAGSTLVTLAKWSTGDDAEAFVIVSVIILIKLPTVE